MFSVLGVLLMVIANVMCGSPSSSPFWGIPGPVLVYQRPLDAMVDVTNDLGISVLQDYAYTRSNFAFSPYGVASVLVVLYEGARGESARQIHNTLRLPWNREYTRIGFRDIHRHLRSYFSHEGYLSGLTLNKNQTSLLLEYRRVLRFYGYDVGMGPGHQFPPTTTKKPTTTTTTTTEPTTTETITETTVEDLTTETVTSTTASSERATEIATEDLIPSTTTIKITTEDIIPPTTTIEDIIPPITPTSETTTEDLIPPTTTTRTTTEDIIPPTTTTRRSTTEDIIPPGRPLGDLPSNFDYDEVTSQLPVKTSTPENIPQSTTEDIIPPTTTTRTTTEDIIPPTTTTRRSTTEDIIPPGRPLGDLPSNFDYDEVTSQPPVKTSTPENIPQSTTEDIIPPTTTTRTTTEDIIPPTTTTRRSTTEVIIPPERPLGDLPSNFDYDEVMSQPPVKTSTPENIPQSTEPASKEMPEDDVKPTLPSEDTPTPTDHKEVAAVTTEAPVLEASTESTSVESASAADAPAMTEVPHDEPVETMVPTEVPEESPETMATTESEAEIISPEITTLSNPPTTESNDETIASTKDNVTPVVVESTTEEANSEVPEMTEVLTTSSYPPELENTISSDITDAATSTEGPTNETLAELMSNIVKTKVKFTEPIPMTLNSSKTSNARIKRSLADPAVVFPDISLQLQNGMFDSQVRGYEMLTQLPKRPFLVDGVAEELVPVMSYTAIFPFAYIRRLHAQVLEFPLDDERYKLLLILPVERRGLRQLIYDLSSCPLREVYQAMRPTRVQAIIPSFMVEGFVILTPTLQQLGIWDVFDPRRANLSGMSNDPDLFVRNIEQAVTVVIRNYVKILDIQTRTMAARTAIERFVVTHPFLYFVMDTDTHVALMAGKVVDPLNSRIY